MRVVVATRNHGKVKELTRLFALPSLTLVSLDNLPPIADVIEDADTFEGNARKKAWETSLATGLPALADDSGLAVDALNGAPGIHSARYAGEHGNDGGNVDKLLHEMRNVPDGRRQARFVCVLAFADPRGALGTRVHLTRGAVEGRVLRAPQGNGGFGYDPVLMPEGKSLSMAELTVDEKNAFSHRAKAAEQMRAFLTDYLAS